jgi:hypothetical protein
MISLKMGVDILLSALYNIKDMSIHCFRFTNNKAYSEIRCECGAAWWYLFREGRWEYRGLNYEANVSCRNRDNVSFWHVNQPEFNDSGFEIELVYKQMVLI